MPGSMSVMAMYHQQSVAWYGGTEPAVHRRFICLILGRASAFTVFYYDNEHCRRAQVASSLPSCWKISVSLIDPLGAWQAYGSSIGTYGIFNSLGPNRLNG